MWTVGDIAIQVQPCNKHTILIGNIEDRGGSVVFRQRAHGKFLTSSLQRVTERYSECLHFNNIYYSKRHSVKIQWISVFGSILSILSWTNGSVSCTSINF